MTDEQFLAYIATFKKDDRVIEIGQSGLMGRCGDVYFDEQNRVCVLWDGWHDDDPPGRMGSSVTHGTRLLSDVMAAANACDGMPAAMLAGLPSWTPGPLTQMQGQMRELAEKAAASPVPAPPRRRTMSEEVNDEIDREESAKFLQTLTPYEVCRRCGYVKTPEVSPHCKPRWKDVYSTHEWVRAVPRPAKTNADTLIEAGVPLAKMPDDTARCIKCGMTRSESRQKYCGRGVDKDNAHDYVPIPPPERDWQKVRSVFHTPPAGVLHDEDFASIAVDPATGQPQRQPQVKGCDWCPNPRAPDPAFHPGGQAEHAQPASPPDAKMLAVTFKAVLRRWLTPSRLRIVDDRNKVETDPRICHSHDLCDSNQAMIDALWKYGIEFNGQDDQQHNLINAAWDIAKKEGFST